MSIQFLIFHWKLLLPVSRRVQVPAPPMHKSDGEIKWQSYACMYTHSPDIVSRLEECSSDAASGENEHQLSHAYPFPNGHAFSPSSLFSTFVWQAQTLLRTLGLRLLSRRVGRVKHFENYDMRTSLNCSHYGQSKPVRMRICFPPFLNFWLRSL